MEPAHYQTTTLDPDPLSVDKKITLKRLSKEEFEITSFGQKAGKLFIRVDQAPILAAYHGHLEYEIFPKFRGNGLAKKACESVKTLLKQEGISSLWITCNEGNLASKKTIENLGAKYLGKITLPNKEVRNRYVWKF